MSSTGPAPTPTRTEISETVTGVVATELGLDPAALDPDTDLRAVEGADSVKVLRILARIEQRYDIELDDADVFEVTTPGEIAAVVGVAVGAGT